MMRRLMLDALVLLAGAAACAPDPAPVREPADTAAPTVSASDSATSMTFLLRRFQAATRQRPRELEGASHTREMLALDFLRALESGDSVAIATMRVSRDEFAHLYFPESVFMRPPYELDPTVLWMQIDAASSTGLRRGLQHFRGKSVVHAGLTCQEPQVQGSLRIHGCDVLLRTARGDTVRTRMFGAIMERDGRFKFLSLENKL